MKSFYRPLTLAATVLLASTAFAQTPPVDKAAANAARRAQGTEAARTFVPGEGNPKPEAGAKVDRADRIAASEARKPGAIEAVRTFKSGEVDPKAEASVELPRAERTAARKNNRDQVVKLNKTGQLPAYGESYGEK